jgi:hypothetical protein
MSSDNLNLDRPLWGAEAIARELGLIEAGATEQDIKRGLRQVFHQLERGYWDVDRVGRRYRTTPRRLRRPLPENQWPKNAVGEPAAGESDSV